MTSGAIHVAQVPESGWPCPLPPPLGCNLSTNRKRKPKWRRCVAASIAVGPSAILTGSRTRPSDWGSNARFGPVEDRRNNRRLATFTCTLCVLQIWWLSPLSISDAPSAHRPPGYPLSGCVPAEPDSVSPGNIRVASVAQRDKPPSDTGVMPPRIHHIETPVHPEASQPVCTRAWRTDGVQSIEACGPNGAMLRAR